MPRHTAAIIGLGRIAHTVDDELLGSGWLLPFSHAGSYREVPEVDLIAGADPYAEQRAAFGPRWGVTRLYADYREMLDRERPDIVSVCTSARPRAQIITDIARADAGVKAVWAEKPLAFSLAEADAIVDACRASGIKLAVNCRRYWDPYYGRARELVDRGELGRVLQITLYYQCGMSHNGCHAMGAVLYLAGADAHVAWVTGEVESDARAASDDDLSGNAYMALSNGVRAFVRMMPCGPANWSMDVIGERGQVRILNINDGYEFELWRLGDSPYPPDPRRHIFPRPQRVESDGVRAVRDIVACIETGGEPACNGETGRELLETAIAIRESHRRGGQRVELPLADRSLLIRSSETLAGDLPAAMRPGEAERLARLRTDLGRPLAGSQGHRASR